MMRMVDTPAPSAPLLPAPLSPYVASSPPPPLLPAPLSPNGAPSRSAPLPRPAPSLNYDEARALLEQARDQEDTRDWVNRWIREHPDQEITPVTSRSRPDGVDWVATQEAILSRSGPSLTTEELLSQLDEQAHSLESSEPSVASVIEDTANELRQAELESDLAIATNTPLPDEHRRRRQQIQVEDAMARLREARGTTSRSRRDEIVQQTRRELTELLREMIEAHAMGAHDFDVPEPPKRNCVTRKQWVERSLRNSMAKINARSFASRNRAERLKTLQTAIGCLRELRNDMPADVYRSHYQATHIPRENRFWLLPRTYWYR